MAFLAARAKGKAAHYLGVSSVVVSRASAMLSLISHIPHKSGSYKILFLDVLFPLDLEKVIFVDADQVSTSAPIGYLQSLIRPERRIYTH